MSPNNRTWQHRHQLETVGRIPGGSSEAEYVQRIGERPPSPPTRRAERTLHPSGEDPGECSSWRRSGRAAGASTEPEADPAAGGADHPRGQLRRIDRQEPGAPSKATGGQQSKTQEPENRPDGRPNQGAEPPTRRPGREAAGIHTATPGSSPTRSDRQGRRSDTAAGGEAPRVQQNRKGSRTERPETTPRGSGRAAGVEIMEARTGSRRRKYGRQ